MGVNLSHFRITNESYATPENVLMIVGTALDGPSGVPFQLYPDKDPYQVLGNSPLADAYVAAIRAGTNNVIAYRINGVHATAILKNRDGKQLIKFESVSASDNYNDIQMVAYPDHLYIVNTDSTIRTYFFDKYPTVRELAYGINRDAFYGLVEFNAEVIDEYYPLANLVDNPTDIMFEGGLAEEQLITNRDPASESEVNPTSVVPTLKDRIASALFGEEEDILERQPNTEIGMINYGVIVLCDIYHEDDPEITEMLGSFCMNKTSETGYGCIGVIGTQPIYKGDFSTDIDLETEDEDFDVTVHNKVLDLVRISESLPDTEAYKYVQVVVGHTKYPESKSSSIATAYGYAATQALLPCQTMMTNKTIAGLGKLTFEISKEDIALLSANGYTCIVPSIRRGFVPYYASSYSKDIESVVSRPHHLRISQYVSRILTEELDSLIGNMQTALSLEDAMKKATEILDGIVTDGIVREYSFSYELLENNTVLNIDVSLTPFSEVRAVQSMATISYPQGVVV